MGFIMIQILAIFHIYFCIFQLLKIKRCPLITFILNNLTSSNLTSHLHMGLHHLVHCSPWPEFDLSFQEQLQKWIYPFEALVDSVKRGNLKTVFNKDFDFGTGFGGARRSGWSRGDSKGIRSNRVSRTNINQTIFYHLKLINK